MYEINYETFVIKTTDIENNKITYSRWKLLYIISKKIQVQKWTKSNFQYFSEENEMTHTRNQFGSLS